jgi:signal transduction histidine kinase
MNPLTELLVHNIVAVYFFYGLAFFSMGLGLALANRETSTFRFAQAIVPLAAFSILHGIHEWVEMFQRLSSQVSEYSAPPAHEIARVILLALSFLMLLGFGLVLLGTGSFRWRNLLLPVLGMVALWLVAVAVVCLGLQPSLGEGVAMADVLARYSLGIPAALLGVWGMMTQQHTFREHGMPQFGRTLVWAATAMLLYGVIGQMFVPKTALVPSNVINSELFLRWFGIPVQLFRGLLAVVIAVTMIRALNAFTVENRNRLEEANRAKLEAQREALRAERLTSRERARLNEDLRRTAQELGLLLELSNLLARPMTLQDRLDAVLLRLVHSLHFPSAGMILLVDAEEGDTTIRTACGYASPEPDRWYQWSQEIGQRCAEKGLVVCRHLDSEILEIPFQEVLSQPKCQVYDSPTSVLGLPLFEQSKVIGSIVLAQSATGTSQEVTPEELELILGVARQLGLSIENARLAQEAQEREQQLGELLHQVVNAQEMERQRIARELHDATSQSLTAIALGLRGVEGMVENRSVETAELALQVRELKKFSTTALGELRQIIADLRPTILDDMGLAAAIQWYVQSFRERTAMEVSFILEGEPVRLALEYETVLFRIGQEALANVAKHSHASQVTVVLRFAPGFVCLVVEDNGVGFSVKEVDEKRVGERGWGLRGIRERASLLDGKLAIDSEPGQGTRIWITVPYSSETGEMPNVESPVAAG